MGVAIDLTGKKFGRLTFVEFSHRKGKNYYWKVICDCGNERIVQPSGVKSGRVISCGCYNKEVITKHGLDGTKLYHVLLAMKNRCYSPKSNSYQNYGARGITIHEEWLDNPQSFVDWSLQNGYKEGLSIDRINNDGNYEPDNCRWVEKIVQANNTRTNLYIEYNGETKTLSEWAAQYGIKMGTLYYRYVLKDWDIERALNTPVRR